MSRWSRIVVSVGALTLVASLPPGGTFEDDNGSVHEGYIEAIAAEGITKGCNPPVNDAFCPKQPVTRGEAAAFLTRAFDLTAVGSVDFADDDQSIFEADIERLAAAGITKGCNPPTNDRFCPDDPVTREQMAAFLVRAFSLPDGPDSGFIDLAGSVFIADIGGLAAAGITKGCNPPDNDRFCPRDVVTREQMASFLGRALGLEPFVARPFGGEIVVAVPDEPVTLNPLAPAGMDPPSMMVGSAYLAGAFRVDGGTGDYAPDLVTSLPTVENGGVILNGDGTMTVAFDIHPDAVWSDGVPVSGDDFQFTMDIFLDPNVPVDPLPYENVVTTFAWPERFELTLATPTLEYERLFPIVLPRHAMAGTDVVNDWDLPTWPSAGPFVLDPHAQDGSVRVVRNDQYWRTDPTTGMALPFVDSVVFEFHPGEDGLGAAIGLNHIDVVGLGDEQQLADQVVADGDLLLDVAPGRVWEHVNFQFGPGRLDRNESSINQHLGYRRAWVHAIDRKAIADEVFGGHAVLIDSMTGMSGADLATPGWSQYPYDAAMAQDLFGETRRDLVLEDILAVFSTTSNYDPRVRLAELMAGFASDVGIQYENQLEDSQQFFGEIFDRGLWDVGSWAWHASPGYSGALEMLQVFDPDGPPSEGANYYRWGTSDSDLIDAASERFADILDLLETEIDLRVAGELVREAEQILADNVIIIPLYARPVFLAYRADEVGGMEATGQQFTWNIGEWYRLDV